MVFKRKTFKRKAPKRAIKKRGYRTNSNLKSLNPIPQRYICKMKYSETVTTDAQGRFNFNLNSIFDPNRTGIGHQPYGHDTFATIYNRYRVIACSYVITCLSGQALQLSALPANDVVTMLTNAEVRENPRSRFILQNAGADAKMLRGKVYIPSLTGRTKSQYMSDDRYQAQMGSSPSELAILNLLLTNSADTALSAITLQVTLEYTVELFDAINLAQS